MHESTTATTAFELRTRTLRPGVAAALVLCLAAWTVPHPVVAQSFILEIEIDPEQTGAMPVYEVVLGDDVDTLDLYRFAEDCQRRASVSTGDDWFLEHWSPDDQLTCRFRAATSSLEMEIETSSSAMEVLAGQQRQATEQKLVVRIAAEAGYEQRARFDQQLEPWSPWTTGNVLASLPVPEAGQETTFHFEVQRRGVGGTTVSSETGYLKIMKISS